MIENMNDNFSKLHQRVFYSVSNSDLLKISDTLSAMKGNTLVSGVGGSYVVSKFLSRGLEKKNNIICHSITPRDLRYLNFNLYTNIIACSYSGKNLGVDMAFDNDLKKYLFSMRNVKDVININYVVSDVEHSFISLAATLIPMTMALLYYCDNDMSVIDEVLSSSMNFKIFQGDVFEVLSGYDSNTASAFIESTFVEAGIGFPIVHDKYEYCHGRSNLNYSFNNNLIFFNCNNELDKLYKELIKDYYKNVITIDKMYEDDIINDYYFTYISMLLCKSIAENRDKDLSNVKYSPMVKKLYRYNGNV